MMDMYCDTPTQDKHGGWIFLNMGGLQFKKISPFNAWSKDWTIYYTGRTGYSFQDFEQIVAYVFLLVGLSLALSAEKASFKVSDLIRVI